MNQELMCCEIYYKDDKIIAYETEMSKCVVTNKCPYDIYLIFNVDKPLIENRILANSSINVNDERYIDLIKAKDFHICTLL